eukprot:SAG22_NODE_367_length_11613_cov_11.955011_2_plen_97_part_00
MATLFRSHNLDNRGRTAPPISGADDQCEQREQPLREEWLVKQSGGSNIGRRSVGEIMKKWDKRYFVLTTERLYYFKTMEVQVESLETLRLAVLCRV